MQKINEQNGKILLDLTNGWFAIVADDEVTFYTTDNGMPDGGRTIENTMSGLSILQVAMMSVHQHGNAMHSHGC